MYLSPVWLWYHYDVYQTSVIACHVWFLIVYMVVLIWLSHAEWFQTTSLSGWLHTIINDLLRSRLQWYSGFNVFMFVFTPTYGKTQSHEEVDIHKWLPEICHDNVVYGLSHLLITWVTCLPNIFLKNIIWKNNVFWTRKGLMVLYCKYPCG